MTKIIIKGRIPSKKNAKIMVCRGRTPMLLPSKNYTEWHKNASNQIKNIKNIPPNIFLTYTFFAPDNRKADLSNKIESINDLFVDCKKIKDDNWFILSDYRVKFAGVDKDNPRVEIEY